MTAGLEFTITPGNGVMTIGATTLDVAAPSLLPETRTVVWSGTSGKVTYNDDSGALANLVPVPLADPTPYLAFVNAWCTAALAGAPPIGLAQVQQIKTAVVEILFNVKRQAPIAVTVAAGALSWDASDDAVAAISQQLLAGVMSLLQTLVTDLAGDFASIVAVAGTGIVNPFAALVAAINVALGGVVTDVNNALAGLKSDVNGALSGLISDVDAGFAGLRSDVDTGFAGLRSDVDTAFGSLTNAINTSIVNAWNATLGAPYPGTPAVGTLNYLLSNPGSQGGSAGALAQLADLTAPGVSSESAGPESAGSESVRPESINPESVAAAESFSPTITPFSALLSGIPWIPLARTAPVNVTNLELAAILSAILARRTTLQATRLAKEAAIAALPSAAAAIAYDPTAGW